MKTLAIDNRASGRFTVKEVFEFLSRAGFKKIGVLVVDSYRGERRTFSNIKEIEEIEQKGIYDIVYSIDFFSDKEALIKAEIN